MPTDYDTPRGATTTIALTKLPATGPAAKIGSLFTNPGGPGGSGVDFVQTVGRTAYTATVLARYDIIGFDPRGVGSSDPVTCYPDAAAEQAALAAFPAFPVTAKDARAFLPLDAALTASCRQTSGARIAHSSTANVARDLDLLRQAVGDKLLSYVGYSYGTFLGATYGRLFPQSVGKMVLDGTLDPAAYSGSNGDRRPVGARTQQGPASAEVFQQFLARCQEAESGCALNELGRPGTVVKQLFESLKKKPVPIDVGGGTIVSVGYPQAVAIAFQFMYSPAGWQSLATTLAYLARGGDGAPPAAVPEALAQVDRARRTDYASIGGSIASTCVDATSPLAPSGFQRLADAEDRRAPDFGRFRAWTGLECATLGVPDTDAYRGPWTQSTTPPIMVIGTRYDPATPYSFTRPFADLFPDGRMLTVEGYGHTILGKSTCADEAVARYLVDGRAPRDGATCAQSIQPFAAAPAAVPQTAQPQLMTSAMLGS